MMKRVLAFLCVLALMMGMYVVPASAAETSAAEGGFYVGYVKGDINPWLTYPATNAQADESLKYTTTKGETGIEITEALEDSLVVLNDDNAASANAVTLNNVYTFDPETEEYTKEDKLLLKAPMAGYANSTERLSTGLQDDNADGNTGYGDGLFFTCTTVTDPSNNHTLFMFTTDTVSGYENLRKDIAAGIASAMAENNIPFNANQVTLSGSHSHGGVDFGTLRGASTRCANADEMKTYLDELVEEWKEAKDKAEEPYEDADVNNYRTYLENQQKLWGAYYDYAVNKMVDSAVETALSAIESEQEAVMSQGSIDATTVQHANAGNKTYQMNQMRIHYTTQYKTATENYFDWSTLSWKTRYITDENGDYVGESTDIAFISGSHLNTFTGASVPVNGYHYEKEPLAKADDTMYILQFQVGDEKIILINWRAHATTMTPSANTNLSSDYVNSLRYAMEKEGYHVAFIQGAGGNVVVGSAWADEYFDQYVDEKKSIAGGDVGAGDEGDNEDGDAAANENRWARGTYYGGMLLANVAKACLDEKMVVQNGNTIRAVTNDVNLKGQVENDPNKVKAAERHQTKAICKENHGSTGYHPVPDDVDGNVYYINDRSHASSIIKRSKRTSATVTMTVSAFKLGDSVSIVTAPAEMYDRYSTEVTTLGQARDDNQVNDWYGLEEINGNMPFVFGYTNGHGGYVGNYISYIYNDVIDDDDKANDGLYNNYPDGKTIDGVYGVSVGSYEAGTSALAQGEGEKIIAAYGRMLSSLSDKCEHCKTEITEKTALTKANANSLKTLTTGHYYLDEDVTWSSVRTISGQVCLDLNGHTITTNNCQAFKVMELGSTFNLMDSSEEQDGEVVAYNNAETIGGVIRVYNATDNKPDNVFFNLYGGTLRLAKEDGTTGNKVEKGGVVALYGTMNMFGGVIEGGDLLEVTQDKKNATTACGGAIFVYTNSVLNVSGGRIESGSVPGEITDKNGNPYTPKGACVYLNTGTSKVKLSGDAVVEEIYIQATTGDSITVASDFTGTAVLNPEKLGTAEVKVGSVEGALQGKLTCVGDYQVDTYGTDLMIASYTGAARIGTQCYETIDEAIEDYEIGSNNYITLLKDVADVNLVGKTIYMDLNGYTVSNLRSSKAGGKLYCLDSETDDCKIEGNANDGYSGYGTITKYGNNVTLKPVALDDNLTQNGYIMVYENGKGYSFHCVKLQLTDMSLRTEPDEETLERNPGLYFKSAFGGDALVAKNVATYGVALSLAGAPTAETMGTTTQYSWFEDFQEGTFDATSTLLSGVMKESSNDLRNSTNANKRVYGSAYIAIENADGSVDYIFGDCKDRSLKEQVTKANDAWIKYDEEKQDGMIKLYETYRSILSNWDIKTIAKAFQDSKPLKILGIGNSFTGDSMRLLAEVYKAQNNDRKLVLGYLYHSGCTLSLHKKYIKENAKEYIYYELNDQGTWDAHQGEIVGYDDKGNPIYSGVTMDYGLDMHDWDLVSMQQGSVSSGNASAYNSDITYIQNYVNRTLGYKPTYFWNMTWAYPDYSERFDGTTGESGVKGSNTVDMFASIVNATETKVLPLVENGTFSFYIPAGTAIWNARIALLEDNGLDANSDKTQLEALLKKEQALYEDALHLGGFGRAIAAYTWYCKLNGISELDSFNLTFLPDELISEHKNITLTDTQREIGRNAVNAALANPLPDVG